MYLRFHSLRIAFVSVLILIGVFSMSNMVLATSHNSFSSGNGAAGSATSATTHTLCMVNGNVQFVPRICLLQPLDLGGGLPFVDIDAVQPGGTFFNWFNKSANFLMAVAVGVGTLWVLISGGLIVLSGGDAGKRGQAIERITSTILGLLGLIFLGAILRFLNNIFFT